MSYIDVMVRQVRHVYTPDWRITLNYTPPPSKKTQQKQTNKKKQLLFILYSKGTSDYYEIRNRNYKPLNTVTVNKLIILVYISILIAYDL